MEMLDIVNENDEVMKTVPRIGEKLRTQHRRIVHIFVFNDKGEMALQKRSKTVWFLPGAWATAACGHVSAGETYDQAAVRETEEEIGIKVKPKFISKDKYDYEGKAAFCFLTTYQVQHNGPFKVDPVEVDCINFFTIDEITKMIKKGETFHPETLFLLNKHFHVS